MTTTDNEKAALAPQWMRVPQAVKVFGLGKSTLYNLIADGKIKSAVPRTGRGKAQAGRNHGARLISVESLNGYISGFSTGGEETPKKKPTRK